MNKKTKKGTSGKKQEQTGTRFKPTFAEQKLLNVLLNPEHRLKNVSDICSLAPCTRKVYYAAFKKRPFVNYYQEESRSLVVKDLAPIINASIRQAKRGDASHTKILLSMCGMHEDRHAFIGKDGKPQDLTTVKIEMSPLERATRVAYLLRKGIERKQKAEEEERKHKISEKQGA